MLSLFSYTDFLSASCIITTYIAYHNAQSTSSSTFSLSLCFVRFNRYNVVLSAQRIYLQAPSFLPVEFSVIDCPFPSLFPSVCVTVNYVPL